MFNAVNDHDNREGLNPSSNCIYYTDDSFSSNINYCHTNNTSILHINIRSLVKNFDSLSNFMYSINHYNFTFLAITETWLNDTSPINTLYIDGYKLTHINRCNNRRGGGVALYSKDNLDIKIRPDLGLLLNDNAESLFIEVDNAKQKNSIIDNYLPTS